MTLQRNEILKPTRLFAPDVNYTGDTLTHLTEQSRAARLARNFVFGCLLAASMMLTAHAQSGLTPPASPVVTVTPEVAPVGVPRTITFSAAWQDGCVPGNASLLIEPLPGISILTVRLVLPQSLVACTQAVTPYSATLTYTPTAAGVQRISVMLSDGRYLGQGEIITQSASGARAATDVTGVWFDPASNGSGLSLFHAQDGSDVAAGTWYLYNNSGTPTWFLIQNTRWESSTTLSGDLVIYSGTTVVCPSLSSQIQFGCPRPAANSTVVARFFLQVESANSMKAYAIPVSLPASSIQSAVFSSNLTRLQF